MCIARGCVAKCCMSLAECLGRAVGKISCGFGWGLLGVELRANPEKSTFGGGLFLPYCIQKMIVFK